LHSDIIFFIYVNQHAALHIDSLFFTKHQIGSYHFSFLCL